MTNRELKLWYLYHNKNHFGSELPLDTDVRWHEPTSKKLAGEFLVDLDSGQYLIWINPALRKINATCYAHQILVHEMIHCLLKVRGYKKQVYSGHGRVFKQEQARLETLGVIRELW